MKKQTAITWMQGKLARHRRAAQVAAFSQPPAPPVSPARPPQAQPTAIAQPTQPMTEALNVTTSAKKINALAAEAGAYIVSQASRLIDGATENTISELTWTIGGVAHTLMATQITPYRGNFASVKPMNRFALVRSQAGNEAHAQRLAAAVRSAMGDRDVVAADAAIRSIGAEGFDVAVVGV